MNQKVAPLSGGGRGLKLKILINHSYSVEVAPLSGGGRGLKPLPEVPK